MRSFLSKYLDAAELDKLEDAYKSKNEGATGLPVYIPKSRFDSEIEKRKAAEKDKDEAVKVALKPFEGVPEDWKKQLDDLKVSLTTQKTEYDAKLAAASKEADVAAKIYGAGARNFKAVRALIVDDDKKTIDDQLTALKTSDAYLFTGGGLPKGTGKGDGDHGGDGDDKNNDSKKLSEEAMYRAVGIAYQK